MFRKNAGLSLKSRGVKYSKHGLGGLETFLCKYFKDLNCICRNLYLSIHSERPRSSKGNLSIARFDSKVWELPLLCFRNWIYPQYIEYSVHNICDIEKPVHVVRRPPWGTIERNIISFYVFHKRPRVQFEYSKPFSWCLTRSKAAASGPIGEKYIGGTYPCSSWKIGSKQSISKPFAPTTSAIYVVQPLTCYPMHMNCYTKPNLEMKLHFSSLERIFTFFEVTIFQWKVWCVLFF